MDGYGGDAYAESLAEFGHPRRLVRSGGWLLERAVLGGTGLNSDRDAMGCYPVFACRDWPALGADLVAAHDLVSVVVVTDPFAPVALSQLDATFNRGAVPFKRHHVVELGRTVADLASPHHRRNARRAWEAVAVECVDDPTSALDDWRRLYAVLVRRHAIAGLTAFSSESFARLLALLGLVAFRAVAERETVGMLLWVTQGDVAYYHLGAYSERGYELRASFALFWRAIEWFTASGRFAWLSLGASAGVDCANSSGLDRFKSGWSTTTRTAYLARHVAQPERYEALVRAAGQWHSSYFPAYRAGEFAPRADHADRVA